MLSTRAGSFAVLLPKHSCFGSGLRKEAALFRCVACRDTAGQVAFAAFEGCKSGFPHEVWAPSTQLALAVETRLAELTGCFSSRTSLPSILCVTRYS